MALTPDPAYSADPSYAAVHRFMVIPAAYVLLQREGLEGAEVLLQLRRGTGYMDEHWASGAAGHVEAGESVLSAAIREAAEELGVQVAPPDVIPLTAMHRTQRDGQQVNERVDFFYLVRRWAGEPSLMESAKSAGLQWVGLDRLDDLSGPVVPHERAVLEALRRGALPPIMTFGFPDDSVRQGD